MAGFVMEQTTLTYSSESSKTYTFTEEFKEVPKVVATPLGNVNVFISAVSKTSVTIEVSSDTFSGDVHLKAYTNS